MEVPLSCEKYTVNRNIKQHILLSLNPFPNDKTLDSSKLKEFANNNLKLDDRNFSKWLENTVGK